VESQQARQARGTKASKNLTAEVSRFQTPTAQDANGRTHHNQRDGSTRASLLGQVQSFPTPHHRDWKDTGPTQGNRKSPNLGVIVQKFPTPTADDSSNATRASGDYQSLTRCVQQTPQAAGGTLNPTWVEWLMGWPLGWTSTQPMPQATWDAWRSAFPPARPESAPLATAKCPPPQPSHTGF
jgi:hypothetical protein